jgi:hypothetical protein
MENRPDEDLAQVISPVGVAAVVIFILGLICLTVWLSVRA